MEKRRHNRYRLTATVIFSWEIEDRRTHQGQGHTRDCSVSGAFIVTSEKVPVGSILRLNFSLPRLLAAGPGTRLETKGCVVRTEADGFAVSANMGTKRIVTSRKFLDPSSQRDEVHI